MEAILVTGAGSGLGAEFVRRYRMQYPAAVIYVVDRRLPDGLLADEQIKCTQLDLIDDQAIEEFGRKLMADGVRLDLVVHSAGVRGLEPSVNLRSQQDVQRADELEVMTRQNMLQTFDINCAGTFALLRALLPTLHSALEGSAVSARPKPRVVVMGSRMGSIGSNTSQGGGYAYRASKAALNAIIKSFSIDVPEVLWTVVHPGRVESGLVAIKEDGAMTAREAVDDVVKLVDRLTDEFRGCFLDRFGHEIMW